MKAGFDWLRARVLARGWWALALCAVLIVYLFVGEPSGSTRAEGDILLATILLGIEARWIVLVSSVVTVMGIIAGDLGLTTFGATCLELGLPMIGIGAVRGILELRSPPEVAASDGWEGVAQ